MWLPVHPDPVLQQQMEARITHLLTPALQAPPGDSTLAKTPPAEAKEKKAGHSEGRLRCSLLELFPNKESGRLSSKKL
jgi:hypothetical protein